MENKTLTLSELTVIASDVSLTGTLEVAREVHIYGRIRGELHGKPGSTILIKESAQVEGKVFSDIVIIDGFVNGDVDATQKVWITARGRMLGSVTSPSLQVDPGAIFEARVKM